MKSIFRGLMIFASLLSPIAAFGSPTAPKMEVNIWIAGDVAPGPKVRMTLNTLNVGAVHLSAMRSNDLMLLIKRAKITREPSNTAVVKEWNVSMLAKGDHPSGGDVYRSKQTNLPTLAPGIYVISAQGGGETVWATVNITNLSVVVKRSQKRALTWVTDAKSGHPIENAKVTVYQNSGKNVKAGLTGQDGVSLISIAPAQDQTFIVTRGRDIAAVPCGNESTDGRLVAHVQTDRPIYRPGQTVLFKAILRRTKGRGYVPLADKQCTVQARDSKDNVFYEKKLTTTAIGSLSDQIELTSEGPLGDYSIVVTEGKDTQYYSFAVAEYRKPDFKVDLNTASKRYLAGQDIVFNVAANYYFGAPLPQAQVHYEVRQQGNPYYGGYDETDDWYADRSGNMGVSDIYGGGHFIAEGTVYTDKDGKVTIPLKTSKTAPDSAYSVTYTVQDASRRQVQAVACVPVYMAALRLGLSTDVLVAPAGSLIPVQVRATDLDGKPVSTKVTLDVRKAVWNEKTHIYESTSLTSTKIVVPTSGKASAQLPAKAEGDISIVASAFDQTGRKTSTGISVWVASATSKPEKENAAPVLTLKPDRRSYEPGQVAKIWVSTNTDHPILLSANGQDIFEHEVVPAGKKGFLWSFKTNVEMSPNAYAEADQWSKSERISANTLLRIPDRTRKMAVTIEPDKTAYRPGDTATWTIHTKGLDGKAVPAEACVSAIDESIYAIKPDNTPDPYAVFWGIREDSVVTNSSAPEELSGGAFQGAAQLPAPLNWATMPKLPAGAKVATVRERFLDTAFWQANVMTDMDGTAKVSFDMPGNMTTWEGKALAITEDTKAGQGQVKTLVSRPVMLRLATPRQMVQGDRIQLAGTINNQSGQEHEFEVELTSEGFTIEGDAAKKIRVPANGEAKVEWTIEAPALPDSGRGSLNGVLYATDVPAASIEDLSDALKVSFPIAPKGTEQRILLGGAMQDTKDVVLELPADRIEPASQVVITARVGLKQVVDDMTSEVLASGRYCTLAAADQLEASAAAGLGSDSREVRESIAMLSRYQHGSGGWGWWEDDSEDPVATARVLTALARADAAGIKIQELLPVKGVAGAYSQYGQTNLWEHRALLASAIYLAETKAMKKDNGGKAATLLDEVHRRGEDMSPYARLSLTEAYAKAGKTDWAKTEIASVMKDAVISPETAYVPVGDRPGWSATTIEATAQALIALESLSQDDSLQAKFARWLAKPEDDTWLSDDEQGQTATALVAYLRKHPEPAKPGTLVVTVNGQLLTQDESKPTRVTIPRNLLKDGANTVSIKQSGGGDVFYSVEARIYVPRRDESREGIRVARKYETLNDAGMWEEVTGSLKPSAALRCTTLIWPDNKPDGLRVVEPLPAGFEFVDSDHIGYAREEVRDAAVVHYLRSSGEPTYLRYYLRAESEGSMTALPAYAEAVRRPAFRGNASEFAVQVKE